MTRMGTYSCRPLKLRFLVVACLTLCVRCQEHSSRSSLALNSTLYFQNTTLVSTGGVFQVGLTSGVQGNLSSPVYTLAIWYAQPPTPAQTVVWIADRSMALDNITGVSLKLSPQGDLQVYDNVPGNSSTIVWTTNTTHLNVTSATILDTGNLVLLNKANQVVWQSFDTPCDTLLPNQTFAVSSNNVITAWQNSGDWSEGRYSLTWTNDSNLVAYWRNPYTWFSSPNNTYWPSPIPTPSGINFSYAVLTPGGDFRAVDVTGNSTSLGTSAVLPESGTLLRVTLDTDGNIRMYSLAPCSSTWNVEWIAMANECSISGHCGRYAICDAGQCRCPFGFQLVDPTDQRLGCERTKPVACGNNSAEVADTFGPVEYADWGFLADYTRNADLSYYTNVSISTCLSRCLAMCQCQAAVMSLATSGIGDDSVTCWLKSLDDVLNGTTNPHRQSYLRIAGSPATPASGVSRESLKIVATMVGAAAGILAVLACAFGSGYCSAKMQERQRKRLHKKWVAARGAMVRFTCREIVLMTKSFEVKIGEGGYGTVFKGQIGHSVPVAVKRLNKELSTQMEKEFLNEVDSIGLIHHVNLVSLLGYCAESGQRFLVYEYMEKGSLDAALFRGEKAGSPVLEWRPRFAYAIHTARGLAYLHDDCDQQIIHCDVKPENILLDSMLSAKVADFGISRIMNRDQTRTVTMHVRGTRGYLAPEYWASDCVSISNKVDVFSYGMVLLELISGRRNLMSTDSVDDILYFPTWAFPKMETEAFIEVVDPALMGLVNRDEVKRALQVAFWCINEKPQQRPSMREVVQMLQGLAPIPLPVPRPDYLDHLEFGSVDDSSSPLHWSSDVSSQRLEYACSGNVTNSGYIAR